MIFQKTRHRRHECVEVEAYKYDNEADKETFSSDDEENRRRMRRRRKSKGRKRKGRRKKGKKRRHEMQWKRASR